MDQVGRGTGEVEEDVGTGGCEGYSVKKQGTGPGLDRLMRAGKGSVD